LAIGAVVAIILLAGVGKVAGNSGQDPGHSGQTAISVNTVPMYRSVIVSPSTVTCGRDRGGTTGNASTATELGFPNGICQAGRTGARGRFPITVTYQGLPGQVAVKASDAVPSGGGGQWRLCGPGSKPACTGPKGRPGNDQFALWTFAGAGQPPTPVTSTPWCDHDFNANGYCAAARGQSQREGIKLMGPSSSGNLSTSWAVTVTWIAMPPPP